MTLDPTFDFEKKRDVPSKYSRELWSKTVEAIKKVEEIKLKREARFMFDRFKRANRIEKERDRNIVRKNLAMIRSPAAGLKKKAKVVVEKDEDEEQIDSDDQVQNVSSDNEELMETC